jgi:hypothetical protein
VSEDRPEKHPENFSNDRCEALFVCGRSHSLQRDRSRDSSVRQRTIQTTALLVGGYSGSDSARSVPTGGHRFLGAVTEGEPHVEAHSRATLRNREEEASSFKGSVNP